QRDPPVYLAGGVELRLVDEADGGHGVALQGREQTVVQGRERGQPLVLPVDGKVVDRDRDRSARVRGRGRRDGQGGRDERGDSGGKERGRQRLGELHGRGA